MILQLLLFALCALGPQDMAVLITMTFDYLGHTRNINNKNDINIIFPIIFHLLLLLPLRVIVTATLYYASALFVKRPVGIASTPPSLIVASPTRNPDNVAIAPTVATAAPTIDKATLIVPEALSPTTAALRGQDDHSSSRSSAIPPLETEETNPSPVISTKTLLTSSVIDEMPVLPEEEEEEAEDRSAAVMELPQLPIEIPTIGVISAPKQDEQTADGPMSQKEDKEEEKKRPVEETHTLEIPAKNVDGAPDVDASHHLVQPSAETPKIGSNSDIAVTTAAAATATASDASGDEFSSHNEEEEEESLSLESKTTSHTSATSSTHRKQSLLLLPPSPPPPPPPVPTPTLSQSLKKDRTFSLRLSRSASSMRNKISATRQKPEEKQQEQQQEQQKQSKPLRLFPLPSLSKRRPTMKKEKQQLVQENEEEHPAKRQPQHSKTRKRFSALFH